jgi:23S rRNA pseudouridine1911/1915/1917 synthase
MVAKLDKPLERTDNITPVQALKILSAIAGPEHAGKRLDSVMAIVFPDYSRSSLAKAVKNGQVTVDGSPAKPSTQVIPGQMIAIAQPESADKKPALAPEIPLKILYEDPFLVAVDKQPGLTVHPGAGDNGPSLIGALLSRYPDISSIGDPDRPGVVHRLDKDTSGLVLVARTPEALESLMAAFAQREARKRYLAFVNGVPPLTGIIDSPISRHPSQRHRMVAGDPEGKQSLTSWRVLKRFRASGISLISVRLFTGRTHQARVHLSYAGYPVLGDPLYGHRLKALHRRIPSLAPLLTRQLLHARRLSVPHPSEGRVTFSAPWPDDFLMVFKMLEQLENM